MIVVDTNVLMEIDKVDIFDQLLDFLQYGEVVVLSSTIDELRNIGTKKAKLALEVIALKGIKVVKVDEKSTDRAILKLVKPERDAVVTNDKKLIKELKERNIKVIRLRQRKYLFG